MCTHNINTALKALNIIYRNWFPGQKDLELLPSVKSLGKTQNEPGKRAIKRSAMLNKLFMKHISDMMSTGTVAMDVVGKGIEISRVNYVHHFSLILMKVFQY